MLFHLETSPSGVDVDQLTHSFNNFTEKGPTEPGQTSYAEVSQHIETTEGQESQVTQTKCISSVQISADRCRKGVKVEFF